MGIMRIIFGILGGFIAGQFITQDLLGGGIGAAIGGIIVKMMGSSIGKNAVESESNAISGKNRSVAKTIFWWFILFAIGASALIIYGNR